MAGSLVVRNPGRPQLRRHSRQLAQTHLIAFFTADDSQSFWYDHPTVTPLAHEPLV
jgi:hypothetical protein